MKKKYIVLLVLILVVIGIFAMEMGLFKDSTTKDMFVDSGVVNKNSDDWFILDNVTKSITTNGTIVSTNSDSGIYANKPSTPNGWNETFDWSSPFTIEFDIIKWDGDPSIRIVADKNATSKTFSDLGIKNGSHVKIVSNDTTITYIIDGKKVDSVERAFKDAQIGIRLVNSTVEYKNFRIY